MGSDDLVKEYNKKTESGFSVKMTKSGQAVDPQKNGDSSHGQSNDTESMCEKCTLI